MAFTETGNFVARGADKVDPILVDILRQAAAKTGMSVEAYSGYRPGDPRFHGKGKATDVRVMGADGKPVPNYQSPEGFSTYEKLAKQARQIQMETHPELADQFRWGGYFGGPKGKYGAMDLMHFDLGGGPGLGMAGGSWDKGLNDQQAALFGMQNQQPSDPQIPISSQIAARPNSPPLPPGAPAPPLHTSYVKDHPIMSMAPDAPPSVMAAASPQPQQTPWDVLGQMALTAPQQPQFQPVEIRGPSPEQAQALTSFLEALKKRVA